MAEAAGDKINKTYFSFSLLFSHLTYMITTIFEFKLLLQAT